MVLALHCEFGGVCPLTALPLPDPSGASEARLQAFCQSLRSLTAFVSDESSREAERQSDREAAHRSTTLQHRLK